MRRSPVDSPDGRNTADALLTLLAAPGADAAPAPPAASNSSATRVAGTARGMRAEMPAQIASCTRAAEVAGTARGMRAEAPARVAPPAGAARVAGTLRGTRAEAPAHVAPPAHVAAPVHATPARPAGSRRVASPAPIGAPRPAALDGARKLAVALHDVEPASHARCAEIREWLHERGVDRLTLLVIPAPHLHPFPARSPELTYWLLDRQDAGDAIAQHGLQHRQTRPGPLFARPVRRWQGGAAAEYAGMDAEGAAESVEAGRRVLTDAGLAPRGFVAPAYAYTGALRAVLTERFDWWATLLAIHGRPASRAPALCLGTSGAVKRVASPLVMRAGAALSPGLLRLDLHPADFDHPRHVQAVEGVLRRARERVAVTYDDLC